MPAAQIYLIPFSELAVGQAAQIRDRLVNGLIEMAVREQKLSAEQLVVRDIRAKDDLTLYTAGSAAGVEDWGCVTGSTANTYEDFVTGTMADQRYVGIYGVKTNPDIAASALRFDIGGSQKVIWQLQALSEKDDYVGFSLSSIIIPPTIPYDIERFVRVASSAAFILLKGVVVEPRGKVVTP